MNDAAVVRLEGVGLRYGASWALRDLNLSIGPGESVALLGPSGAGKSTLLRLLNGSLAPTEGRVIVLGEDLAALTVRTRRVLQRRIGLIHQDLDLIEQVRVIHNVNAGRLGDWSLGRSVWSLIWPQERESSRAALERVGLGWALYEHTARLSGGERQRVAIARVLIQNPDLVLADEPVASLDPSRSSEVLALLRQDDPRHSLVVSLHQPELARRHCTRAIGLRDGQIIFDRLAETLTEEHLGRLYEVV